MFFVRMIWFYHLRKFFISSSPVWTCGDFVHPPINPPLGSCECKPTWFVLDRNLMRPLIWYSWAVTVRLTLDNSPRLESKHEIEKGVRPFWIQLTACCGRVHFWDLVFRWAWFLCFAFLFRATRLAAEWVWDVSEFEEIQILQSSCMKIRQFCLPTSVHGRLVCSFYVWGALLVSYKLVSCFDTTRAEF